MKINRNFKDSVFTSLFNDPAVLKELYCALENVSLPADVSVSINKLKDALVKVLNINDGKNKEIVNRSKNLNGYAIFIAKAREYWKEYGDLLTGIKEAVKYCKKHGILREYLEEHKTEVINMLFGEWNIDTAMEVRYEEGFEDGVEQGHAEGHAEEKLAIARNLLADGSMPEFIQKITGLSLDEIARL